MVPPMADRRKRSAAKQARRDARRRKAQQRDFAESPAPDEVPLIDEVREALDSGHPIDLLGLASMVIVATTAQPAAVIRPSEDAPPGLDELVAAFSDVEVPETTALLKALGELVDDDALRDRCRREAARRGDHLPLWLEELAQTRVDTVVRMTHVLGDGDELLLDVQLADGQQMTCCVFVDHLSMSEVKDAFFVPEPVGSVLAVARANNTDQDVDFIEMALAEARTMLTAALEQHLKMFMAEDSDTWPASRALVQWLTRLLPLAGSAVVLRQENPPSAPQVCERFFASLVGAPFTRRDHHSMLMRCIEEGTGDPLRWSATRLALLLGEELGYDPAVPLETQLAVPELLRAFVPFAHAESGIRQELTVEALGAIDQEADDYRAEVLAEAELGRA
jgi:hypothetical protein